jgi:alkanesulfonate monooxygenase SsuD/methylene tetrahydromethanopterin reductase-like flavin-dependent oxidoreductase (luciferase family)
LRSTHLADAGLGDTLALDRFKPKQIISKETIRNQVMTGEWNNELPVQETERVQIWIIGNREQVNHAINEFYVKRIATDRVQFTPIVPAPFATGKYMTVLVR